MSVAKSLKSLKGLKSVNFWGTQGSTFFDFELVIRCQWHGSTRIRHAKPDGVAVSGVQGGIEDGKGDELLRYRGEAILCRHRSPHNDVHVPGGIALSLRPIDADAMTDRYNF